MLYGQTGDAYGAHVAVFIGDGKVIHLSQENGKPEVLPHKSMLLNEKYRCFVGAKRILKLGSTIFSRINSQV